MECKLEHCWMPYQLFFDQYGENDAAALHIGITNDDQLIYVARTKLQGGLFVPGYAINGVGYFVSILDLNHAFQTTFFDVIVQGEMVFRHPESLPPNHRFKVGTYEGNPIYIGSISVAGSFELCGLVYLEQCYINVGGGVMRTNTDFDVLDNELGNES